MEPITAIASSGSLGRLDSLKPHAVSAADVQRFENAMQTPTTTNTSAELNSFGQLESQQTSTQSIGGAFIEGIQDIKNTLDARAERITQQLNALAGSPMSLQDAIRVQYELMQMNMQQELTSKMADKTSQGVQMLFRNQG